MSELLSSRAHRQLFRGACENTGGLTVSTRPTMDFFQTQSSNVLQCRCKTKALSALGGSLMNGTLS